MSTFEDWWTAHADEPKRKQRKHLRKRVRQLEAETETLREALNAARKQAEKQQERSEDAMFAMLDYLDSPAQATVQRATVIDGPVSKTDRIDVRSYGDTSPRYLDGMKRAWVTLKLAREDFDCGIVGCVVGVKIPGFRMTKGLIFRSLHDTIMIEASGPFRDEPVAAEVSR